MKKVGFIFLILFVLASCGHKKEVHDVPSRLLSEQEMISIMADIQILEADLNFRKTNRQNIEGKAQEYYDQLFAHYGITDSIFMENMNYYTLEPATLERIMDSATNRLVKEQERIQ